MSVQYAPGERWRRVLDVSQARAQRSQRFSDDLTRTLSQQLRRLTRDEQLVIDDVNRAQKRVRRRFQYILDRQEELCRSELRRQRLAAKQAKRAMRHAKLRDKAGPRVILHPPLDEMDDLKETSRVVLHYLQPLQGKGVQEDNEEEAKVTVLVEDIVTKMASVVMNDIRTASAVHGAALIASPEPSSLTSPSPRSTRLASPSPRSTRLASPRLTPISPVPSSSRVTSATRFRSVQTPPPNLSSEAESGAGVRRARPSTGGLPAVRLKLTHA